MVNVAVLVSGGGTNLQALIDARQNGTLRGANLALVLSSNAKAFALERAAAAGIETVVVSKKAHPVREDFTRAVLDELHNRSIGLVVLAGFMYVLSPFFFESYENKVVNVHPALIPAFSGNGFYGLRVHEAVLEYGVKLTGATVHFVNEVTDGGAIIMQKAVDVHDDDTPETLQQRVMRDAEHVLLAEAVSLFCENRLIVSGRKVRIA